MNMKHTIIAALVASLPIAAQANTPVEIGAGVAMKSTAYRNYDDSAQPIPLITFDTEWFYADAGEFGFKPYDDGTNRIGTFLSVGGETWQTDDNDHKDFKEFKDKDRAINLGVSYRHKASWGVVKAKVFTDISDEYDGNGGSIGYAYPWVINQKFVVIPGVKVNFMDSDYANYYYGISSRDANTNANVSKYDTGSATNVEFGVMTAYQISQHWKLIAGVNYLSLDDDIKDSPLLTEDNETTAILGAAYKF